MAKWRLLLVADIMAKHLMILAVKIHPTNSLVSTSRDSPVFRPIDGQTSKAANISTSSPTNNPTSKSTSSPSGCPLSNPSESPTSKVTDIPTFSPTDSHFQVNF